MANNQSFGSYLKDQAQDTYNQVKNTFTTWETPALRQKFRDFMKVDSNKSNPITDQINKWWEQTGASQFLRDHAITIPGIENLKVPTNTPSTNTETTTPKGKSVNKVWNGRAVKPNKNKWSTTTETTTTTETPSTETPRTETSTTTETPSVTSTTTPTTTTIGGSNKGSNTSTKTNTSGYPDVVKQVIAGQFGNGQARKDALAKAGYDYNQVQSMVNDAMKGKSYSGGNATQSSAANTNNTQSSVNPLSSSNNYANYDEYRNTLMNNQQNGYIDPNGQWHTGMSQNDFNKSYVSGQQDIFNQRRNEKVSGGRTADQAFMEVLNKYTANPNAYNDQQKNALMQMAMRLGYMDGKGNLAQQNQDGTYGYAIDTSFANPMSQEQFYSNNQNVANSEAANTNAKIASTNTGVYNPGVSYNTVANNTAATSTSNNPAWYQWNIDSIPWGKTGGSRHNYRTGGHPNIKNTQGWANNMYARFSL